MSVDDLQTHALVDAMATAPSSADLALAALLMSYEADEPHVEGPDCPDPSDWYASIKVPDVSTWLRQAHDGDCVRQAITCMRCLAETAVHKAQWLRVRMP